MAFTVTARLPTAAIVAAVESYARAVQAIAWVTFIEVFDRLMRGQGTRDLAGRLPVRTGRTRATCRVYVTTDGIWVRLTFYGTVSRHIRPVWESWILQNAESYARRAIQLAIPIIRSRIGALG